VRKAIASVAWSARGLPVDPGTAISPPRATLPKNVFDYIFRIMSFPWKAEAAWLAMKRNAK
jgi:hypothetical protein